MSNAALLLWFSDPFVSHDCRLFWTTVVKGVKTDREDSNLVILFTTIHYITFTLRGFICSQESPRHDQGEERPEVLAETCLRNLMGCAAYNNIHAVLKPVLK